MHRHVHMRPFIDAVRQHGALAKFELLMGRLPPIIGRENAAAAFAELRNAALADEDRTALGKAIVTDARQSDALSAPIRTGQESIVDPIRAAGGVL